MTMSSVSEGGAKKRRKTVEIVSDRVLPVGCCFVDGVDVNPFRVPIPFPVPFRFYSAPASPVPGLAPASVVVCDDYAYDDGVQHPFSAELEQAIEVLKEAIAKENWEVKGKFPPGIKPLLAQVALKAIVLGEYDENFFNLMPRLFPYNKFTMTVSGDPLLASSRCMYADGRGMLETDQADNMEGPYEPPDRPAARAHRGAARACG